MPQVLSIKRVKFPLRNFWSRIQVSRLRVWQICSKKLQYSISKSIVHTKYKTHFCNIKTRKRQPLENSSVPDPWHFGADPDLVSSATFKTLAKNNFFTCFFCFFTFWRCITALFKDKKSYRVKKQKKLSFFFLFLHDDGRIRIWASD